MKRISLILFLCLFVLSVNYSYADILLKTMGVNPSPEEPKKVELRVDLPKEVKPENILDKQDMDVKYDDKKEVYYVVKEFTLQPGESIMRTIRLQDIWVIPQAELDSIQSEIDKIFKILKGTEFHERIVFLKNNIESSLNQIITSQATPSSSPPEHFSKYRYNLVLLEKIKTDLRDAKALMGKVKTLPPLFTFRLIVGVIAFLGLIAGVFLFVWFKYLKLKPEELKEYKEEDKEIDISGAHFKK